MDDPEKLATQGTQHEENKNKNTTQYVLDITIYANKHKQLAVFRYTLNM